MQDFRPLDVGWAKGFIQYGSGLMIQQTSRTGRFPPQTSDWGSYVGHGGDTYGFLSEQGVIPQLNASFAVVANEDGNGNFVKGALACGIIEIAARVFAGAQVDLKCSQ